MSRKSSSRRKTLSHAEIEDFLCDLSKTGSSPLKQADLQCSEDHNNGDMICKGLGAELESLQLSDEQRIRHILKVCIYFHHIHFYTCCGCSYI